MFPSFVVWFNVLMIFVGAVKYVRILMSGEIGRGTPEHVGQLLWLGFLVASIAAVPFTLMEKEQPAPPTPAQPGSAT